MTSLLASVATTKPANFARRLTTAKVAKTVTDAISEMSASESLMTVLDLQFKVKDSKITSRMLYSRLLTPSKDTHIPARLSSRLKVQRPKLHTRKVITIVGQRRFWLALSKPFEPSMSTPQKFAVLSPKKLFFGLCFSCTSSYALVAILILALLCHSPWKSPSGSKPVFSTCSRTTRSSTMMPTCSSPRGIAPCMVMISFAVATPYWSMMPRWEHWANSTAARSPIASEDRPTWTSAVGHSNCSPKTCFASSSVKHPANTLRAARWSPTLNW